MELIFSKDTPYTARVGSTKKFLKGQVYIVDNDYGRELIEAKVAKEVKPVTAADLKRKIKTNK